MVIFYTLIVRCQTKVHNLSSIYTFLIYVSFYFSCHLILLILWVKFQVSLPL